MPPDNGRPPPPPVPETDSPTGLIEEVTREGIQRPALWRQAIPWAITAVILWWVFRGIHPAGFLAALGNARLGILLPALFGYTAVYAVIDAVSFGLSFRWFVAPDLTAREMIRLRWGAYLFHVLYPPLMSVLTLAYLLRKKGAPVYWTLAGMGFTSLNDLFVVNAVMTFAVILNTVFGFAPELESFWLLPLSLPWFVAFAYFRYVFSDAKDRRLVWFYQHPIMRAAQLAAVPHYLKMYGLRLALVLAGIAAHALALWSFGIAVPLSVVVVVAPLIIGGSFMPISAGGFGGPQLVALILLSYANHDATVLAAYSMSFSACFTLGRAAIGAMVLPGYLRDLRTRVSRLSVDPVTGAPL